MTWSIPIIPSRLEFLLYVHARVRSTGHCRVSDTYNNIITCASYRGSRSAVEKYRVLGCSLYRGGGGSMGDKVVSEIVLLYRRGRGSETGLFRQSPLTRVFSPARFIQKNRVYQYKKIYCNPNEFFCFLKAQRQSQSKSIAVTMTKL